MKVYVKSPDGRVIPHETASADVLKAALLPGYEIVASPLTVLLAGHGEELLAWLGEHGFARTAIVPALKPGKKAA